MVMKETNRLVRFEDKNPYLVLTYVDPDGWVSIFYNLIEPRKGLKYRVKKCKGHLFGFDDHGLNW